MNKETGKRDPRFEAETRYWHVLDDKGPSSACPCRG